MTVLESSIEAYLDHVDSLVGAKGTYSRITEEHERPHVWVVSYRDVPDPGSLTAFTYGLSSIDHPDWKEGRPELLINVDSSSRDWAIAAGSLAKRYRGLCPFSYGNTLRFGERISADSQMSAFFVFAPSVVDADQAQVVLPDRKINLVQVYPIYEEEIRLVEREGVGRFFATEGIDFADVQRMNRGEMRH